MIEVLYNLSQIRVSDHIFQACVVYAFQRLHGHEENIFLKSVRPSSAEQMVKK